jgi:hypothetical protein
MSRIPAICLTAALLACHHSAQVNAPPTTTSATVRPQEPPPSNNTPSEPLWSPAPQPGNSQMPFNPRNFGR